MKAHLLLNVLNHVDPQSTWLGGDLIQSPDGTIYSLSESAKTMRSGESHLVRESVENKTFRRGHRHHRHHKHCHHEAAEAIVLVVSSVDINLEENSMKVTLTWTTPKFRADGVTALALNEIKTTNVSRNGVVLASVDAVDSSLPLGNTFVDTTPLTGDDSYTVDTVTVDGFVSADSNVVDITIAAANPAAAITDLTGVLGN